MLKNLTLCECTYLNVMNCDRYTNVSKNLLKLAYYWSGKYL